MSPAHSAARVAVVGAGPIGLELAVALKQARIPFLHFDRGQIGRTVTAFPKLMQFFSSPARIAIAGVPIPNIAQGRCTREEYLAYLRGVATQFDLDVHTFEEVTRVAPRDDDGFDVHTRSARGDRTWHADRVVLATGGTARPRWLNIPGENLPHVFHRFDEPHTFFRKRILIVGGKNSAAETALRCYHVGARVAVSYRRAFFDPESIKYWLLPELRTCIREGRIDAFMSTRPVAIDPCAVTLQRPDNTTFSVEADFVLLLTGFEADMSLFESAGVNLQSESRVPAFNPDTMETNVPGLFVAGTAIAGSQSGYRVFLENCHVHVDRILAALTGAPPPLPSSEYEKPET